MSDLPSGAGFSFEAVLGFFVTLISGWLGKLHIDVQKLRDADASTRAAFAQETRQVVTREELREAIRDLKKDNHSALHQFETTVTGQLANLSRAVDRLENRINDNRS